MSEVAHMAGRLDCANQPAARAGSQGWLGWS